MNGTVSEEKYVENRVKVTVGNAYKACLYLKVNITNNPVNMFIDTGSPFSINTKVLAEILGVKVQETQVDLCSPDGGEITVYGKADVEMDILGQKIGQEFLIANLDKVNLLGIDFLEKANAEINIKKQILKTSFGRFKLFRNKTNSCARIQVSETISIPPKSEYIFQTWVDKPFQGVRLAEPTKHLLSKGLHVARSL